MRADERRFRSVRAEHWREVAYRLDGLSDGIRLDGQNLISVGERSGWLQIRLADQMAEASHTLLRLARHLDPPLSQSARGFSDEDTSPGRTQTGEGVSSAALKAHPPSDPIRADTSPSNDAVSRILERVVFPSCSICGQEELYLTGNPLDDPVPHAVAYGHGFVPSKDGFCPSCHVYGVGQIDCSDPAVGRFLRRHAQDLHSWIGSEMSALDRTEKKITLALDLVYERHPTARTSIDPECWLCRIVSEMKRKV
jgi:hypothetical protein